MIKLLIIRMTAYLFLILHSNLTGSKEERRTDKEELKQAAKFMDMKKIEKVAMLAVLLIPEILAIIITGMDIAKGINKIKNGGLTK